MGAGGEGGPRGIFFPLNLEGSRGSSTTSICSSVLLSSSLGGWMIDAHHLDDSLLGPVPAVGRIPNIRCPT